VIARHWTITLEDNHTFIAILWPIAGGGLIGVDIFFVLSGFLVSGLLFHEFKNTGTISLGRFLVRRGFKIYPAYWVMLLVTLLIQQCQGARFPPIELWSMALFFQNYLGSIWSLNLHPPWGPTWSLAVEEHFYLILAAMFAVLKAKARKGKLRVDVVPSVFFYTALLCFVARYLTGELTSYLEPGTTMYPSHLRIDSLMFGVLLSYYWHLCWTATFKSALLKRRMALGILGLL